MTNEEERLIKSIQSTLTPDLVPKNFQGNADNPFFGHCYGASEALYRLLGGKGRGYKAQRAIDDQGIPHWWIVAPSGCILDPTVKQYTDFGRRPPYESGVGASFRVQSKRATEIMRRVQEQL